MQNARTRLWAMIAAILQGLAPAAVDQYGYAAIPLRDDHPLVIQTKKQSCRR